VTWLTLTGSTRGRNRRGGWFSCVGRWPGRVVIELVTVDARIVVANVDTYLRFAEALNRLDLTETEMAGLPELTKSVSKKAGEEKVKAAVETPKEKPRESAEAGKEKIPRR
jgi:hypothetical protein